MGDNPNSNYSRRREKVWQWEEQAEVEGGEGANSKKSKKNCLPQSTGKIFQREEEKEKREKARRHQEGSGRKDYINRKGPTYHQSKR